MPDPESADQSGGKANEKMPGRQAVDRDRPPAQKRAPLKAPPEKAAGRIPKADAGRPDPERKVLPDTPGGLAALGGVPATDRLLGLDLRPTMRGALAPPPGNVEFLRHLTPQSRRTIMRKLLDKQRERMRRLARYLRDRRDESGSGGLAAADRESFLEVIAEKLPPPEYNADKNQIERAAAELDKTARMLDILDEMLAMQDYTISRIGTFTQG